MKCMHTSHACTVGSNQIDSTYCHHLGRVSNGGRAKLIFTSKQDMASTPWLLLSGTRFNKTQFAIQYWILKRDVYRVAITTIASLSYESKEQADKSWRLHLCGPFDCRFIIRTPSYFFYFMIWPFYSLILQSDACETVTICLMHASKK